MKLSTVICNYNTRDVLARVVASLLQCQGDLAHEIIVVDNASKDGSAAMIREQFPSVRLIESSVNRWFSGGNNLGMRAALGEYVLILNPDTIMFPDVLQTLVDYLDTHADVGAVTGRMTFADGTPQYTCSQFADYTDFLLSYTFVGTLLHGWRDRRRRIMWYDGWHRDRTRAIEVAPGSLILARRAILNQIDHFDEQLKLFFTDDDLCRRMIGTGCKIHFVGGPTIIHDEHTSLKQVPKLTQQVYLADLITYTRKYHGPILAFILALLLIPTRMVMSVKRWRQK